jgi:outer membrane protein OmpA-like peptidoglycan-associated protein
MTRYQQTGLSLIGLLMLTLVSWPVSAETVKIQGLIKGRSGASLILQTADSETVIVQLTDDTQVGQVQGVFKARRKEMSMAALIPGLAVQIEATYDEHHELVAKSVKFKGDDLKEAQSIQAGLHETRVQTQKSEKEIEKSKAELEKQHAALLAQSERLKEQQAEVAAQQQKIASNKAAIDAAIARFGQLDDYYILDEVKVYFGNGKVNIDPKYEPQLLQLAQKAKLIKGYMIEIKGYASSVGSTALNQKLSDDRAGNVANFLLQQGHIPSTNLLAPAALGESQQVAGNETPAGQAENRRVVVRVLQNKGIAGGTGDGY